MTERNDHTHYTDEYREPSQQSQKAAHHPQRNQQLYRLPTFER
jgi:hypothetical protein